MHTYGKCFARMAMLVLAVLLTTIEPALAQSPENVLLVINDRSPASQRIGEYYARKRALPVTNILHIQTSVEETIDRVAYVTTIEGPIAALLSRDRLQDRVLYIVLTKGVPIRIAGTGGGDGLVSSVDSELTLLYRRLTGQSTVLQGRIANPYFLGARPLSEARRFTHREQDIYLVTRLDAFTVEDALALIDRGMAPMTEGRFVLDKRDTLVDTAGDDWLDEAAKRLRTFDNPDRVILESTPRPARDVSSVLGYYSWGSNDPQNRVRSPKMGFVPGSLAATFVSSDARTFREPPATWVPSDSADQTTWFAGGPQSLIGDLIHDGATGVAGQVAEPFLEATIRPEILFPAYLSGLNLAEAFYAAMPALSWQTVVVGDPLCSPFGGRRLTRSELGDEQNSETGLPTLFSRRQVALMQRLLGDAGDERTATLVIRSNVLLQRGDRAGARTALEQAAEHSPKAAGVHFQLALVYEQMGLADAAIDQYRQILRLDPKNLVASNNLAYSLAAHSNALQEALPFAQAAVAGAPQNPAFLDTLGWIEHLLGNDASAAKRMPAAVRGAPQNAGIRLHAAIIYAATGSKATAETELQEALKLNPALGQSQEVKGLRIQLEKLPTDAR